MKTHPTGNKLESEDLHRRQRQVLLGAGTIAVCTTAALALGTAVECHEVMMRLHRPEPLTSSLLYGAVLWMWWAGVALLLWRAGRRWPRALELSARCVAGQVGVAALVASAHLWLMGATGWVQAQVWPVWGPVRYDPWRFFQLERFGLDICIYGLIWLACSAIFMQIVAQQSSTDALELRQQLTAAQLSALQMQMEPHFLLNTLNAITALVELERNQEARETLSRLSGMLQTTLERQAPVRVPLARELRLVEDYLAIERVRFADRLTVNFHIDPLALDGLVPCFLLQPLVENSIRHGIAQREEEGRIEAYVERREDRLHMRVLDNGPGLAGKRQPGHGIGLRNTEQRLRHFYKGAYGFTLREPQEGGFEVSITIPYEQEARCI